MAVQTRLFAPIGPRKDIKVIMRLTLSEMLSCGEPGKFLNCFFLLA